MKLWWRTLWTLNKYKLTTIQESICALIGHFVFEHTHTHKHQVNGNRMCIVCIPFDAFVWIVKQMNTKSIKENQLCCTFKWNKWTLNSNQVHSLNKISLFCHLFATAQCVCEERTGLRYIYMRFSDCEYYFRFGASSMRIKVRNNRVCANYYYHRHCSFDVWK